MDGAVAKGEKRAAGVPTKCAIVSFDFVGKQIDLITGKWKVSRAANVAIDLIDGFEHHGAVIAVGLSDLRCWQMDCAMQSKALAFAKAAPPGLAPDPDFR